MSLTEMRARIKAGVWQAVARSQVDVSAVPQADMDKLVAAITEGILGEIDDVLEEAAGRSAPVAEPSVAVADTEQLLWEGRPFLSLSVRYQITSERVRIIEGMLAKVRRDIELIRVQDIDHKQNMTERAFNIGDVFIHSHDKSDPEVVLSNVSNPEEVHEILRRAVLEARKRHNLSYREEM